MVGVDGPAGPKALVFEDPKGALGSAPEEFSVTARVTALGLGFLDNHYAADLAIAAGDELVIVSGRDRKLSLARGYPVTVKPARQESLKFDSAITSLVVGDFADDTRTDIALLTADGQVRFVSRSPQKAEPVESKRSCRAVD